jgi:hypothetical protein
MTELSEIAGHTIIAIEISRDEHRLSRDQDKVVIQTTGGAFQMQHDQSCCESVNLLEVVGDPKDLVDATVLELRCETNKDGPEPENSNGSFLWTFYILKTTKGDLTFRWFGTSNGYYSEEVDFERIKS